MPMFLFVLFLVACFLLMRVMLYSFSHSPAWVNNITAIAFAYIMGYIFVPF